jgi:Tol biopolymer transport system component
MTAKPAEVQAQLERILASSVFSTSARSAQFLRFCVEQSLRGNHDQIKESTVAVEVFGRDPDYNPRTDPIVRVHAKRLREKLDQYYLVHGADDPIRITIPKGGYIPQSVRTLPRFNPKLTEQLQTETEPPRPVPAPERSLPRLLPWFAATGIGLILILASIFFFRRVTAPSPALRVLDDGVPLNAEPGREQNPSWSPDGKLLAFSWDGALHQHSKIYLQHPGDSHPYRLTQGSSSEFRPVWSPDNRSIAFLRYRDSGHFEVVQAPLNGGQERSLGIFSYYWPRLDDQPALDWSPDGKTLLVAEQPSVSSPVRLLLFTLATGERRPLTNPPYGTSGDIDGKFSPDGSLIAIHRGGFGDLDVVTVTGETPSTLRKLTTNNPGIHGIAWAKDGRHVLFSSHAGGSGWGIWQVALDRSEPKPLMTSSLDLSSPAVSPDGTRIAFEREDHITNLARISLEKDHTSQPFAPSSRQDYNPVYSPDGKNVVFISTRSGPMELWLASADGASTRQLTHLDGTGFPLSPSWSPDNNKVIFSLRQNGKTNLAVTEVASGSTRQLTFGDIRYISPVYSVDGRYIYFVSNAGGVGRIWRMPANGTGSFEQMFWDVGSMFQQSRNRKSIFFKDSQPLLHIARRDLDTGRLRDVFQSEKRLTSFDDFCVDDKTLYLKLSPVQESFRSDLVAVDIESGRVHSIATFDQVPPGLASGCSISPDGHDLLLTTVQRDESNIYSARLITP